LCMYGMFVGNILGLWQKGKSGNGMRGLYGVM